MKKLARHAYLRTTLMFVGTCAALYLLGRIANSTSEMAEHMRNALD